MALVVKGVTSRNGHMVNGVHISEADTYEEAVRAIGQMLDRGEDAKFVCFVVEDEAATNWTILPSL